MVFKQRFRKEVFKEFLKPSIRQSRKNGSLIDDGHPVHRAIKIMEWVEKNADNISLFFLPNYTSDLNPDEILNQDFKSNAVGTKRSYDQKNSLQMYEPICEADNANLMLSKSISLRKIFAKLQSKLPTINAPFSKYI